MTNELCINGFSAVSEDEMMAIDGGSWQASIAVGALCVAIGGVCVLTGGAALLGGCQK